MIVSSRPQLFSHYQHIAVAVIVNQIGEILISQRRNNSHLGGYWEFPGGKIESGETVEEGLQRELTEELGIRAIQMRPLIRIPHSYSERNLFLDVWMVDKFDGEPSGQEGQPIKYVSQKSLNDFSFPEANMAIIRALSLANFLLITPDPGAEAEWPQFLRHLKQRLQLADGSLQVVLRAKTLNSEQYQKLAHKVFAICNEHDVPLQLTEVTDIPGVGVHLTSAQLKEAAVDTRGQTTLLSASCHDLEELKRAEKLGADFALLSPVQATKTHPDAKPLGWEQFQEYTDQVSISVYALGGMSPGDFELSQNHGGQGVAAIRALWELPQN